MFFAMSQNQTFWEERLNLFVALAPVTALWHTQSDLFKYGSLLEPEITALAATLKVWHILGDLAGDGTYLLCGALPSLCQLAEGFLITQNPKLDDLERFQVYMGHFPAGASVQSLMHYAQLIKYKQLQLYDYGEKGNMDKYHQKTPPQIDLTRIADLPIAMFVGTADDLGDPTDAEWARDQINKGGKDQLVHYEEIAAGHASFMIGKDMSFFDTCMELVHKYNPLPNGLTDDERLIEDEFMMGP